MKNKNDPIESTNAENQAKLKNVKLIHTSVLQVTATDSDNQPDLRSPEELQKNWHRPPEDLREERKSKVDENIDNQNKESTTPDE